MWINLLLLYRACPALFFYLVDLSMYLRPLGGVVVVVVLLKNRIARFRKFLIA